MQKTDFTILVFLIAVMFNFTACEEEAVPKPKAELRLEYPKQQYSLLSGSCPYEFELSDKARPKFLKNCWMNIQYPELKASINLTYRPVHGNLKELLREAEKLTFNHAIKADGISSVPFVNNKNHTYGALYNVTGNAASPLQFHLTDSTRNFITGAVYFNAEPNYDSILPAIKYIERDLVKLMETLRWKE